MRNENIENSKLLDFNIAKSIILDEDLYNNGYLAPYAIKNVYIEGEFLKVVLLQNQGCTYV